MFVVRNGLIALAMAAAVVAPGSPAAAQDPTAPDGCRWLTPTAEAQTLSCLGSDGHWAPADRPYDIDIHTVTLARAGDLEAMVSLGLFYLDGADTGRDGRLGLDWLHKAAEKGSLAGLRNLGVAYRDGYTAPKDLAEAAHWFSAAATGGDVESMALLGGLYVDGAGVRQDFSEAARWYRAAADKGDVVGMVGLGTLYYRGQGVAKSDADAVRWFRAGADKGDFHAMQSLAFMYAEGLGVSKDEAEVKRWRDRAVGVVHWAHVPSTEELQLSYPVDAAAAGIVGRARYRCRLAGDGSIHQCHLLSEDPPAYGFGKAGRSIAGDFRLAPGLPPGSEINVPIRFALPQGNRIEPRQTADSCAAYGTALAKREQLTGIVDWWARYWTALSRRYALANGGKDGPDRLLPQIAQAEQRLADGKDRGFLGRVALCHLRT